MLLTAGPTVQKSIMSSDHHDDVSDEEAVFLDENDGEIFEEVPYDEEELPDADDEDEEEGSDAEATDEPDDSVHIFTGHTGELYTVACSPTDPNLVATGGGDDRGFLWNIGHGDWAFELKGHTDSISSLEFSRDGLLLASGSFDKSVKVWDISSKSVTHTLDGPDQGIEWVKWHPRGQIILAGSEDSSVWMWNADRGILLNTFFGHSKTVTCGDFTPDGKKICTGSDDATLRVWDPRSGANLHVIQGHGFHREGLTCMSLSSDSTLALTGSNNGSVHLANITTGQVLGSLPDHSDSIECVAFSSSSTPWAATGSLDRKLIIWDLQHMIARCVCEHEDGVACLSWLGTSRYLASGGVDGKVRIWDSLSGDCVRTFSGHDRGGGVQSLAVSANGNYLVSVALDNTARVFEINDFK